MGIDTTAANSNAGSATGVGWWSMMNGSLYEESPPPAPTVSTPVSSPNSVSITVVPVTATTSSTSPSSSSVASNNTGPLHIPAKRLTSSYDSVDPSSGVIRHSHPGSQPWNYSPADNHSATAFEPPGGLNHHQYSTTPTYYNLAPDASSRDSRKLSFWSPAVSASPTQEYKYNPSVSAANPTDPSTVATCHQSFTAQTAWCNYSPYSSASRHHVDHHTHQGVPYIQDESRRAAAAAAMVADGFPHDSYGLRNYGAPDPVPSTPYPPPGKLLIIIFFEKFSLKVHFPRKQIVANKCSYDQIFFVCFQGRDPASC